MGYCQTMLKNLHISFVLRLSLLIILTILFYIAISKFGKVQIKAQEFNLYSLNVGIGESSPPDFISPSVWVTSPSNGALVSGTVSYDSTAFDNVGVTRIEFYADNTLVGTDTSAPYSTLWDTTFFSNNLHTLFAKAFDVAGNIGTSYSISVRVDNLGPSVSITDPTNGSYVSGLVNVQASASDDVAVSNVSFYVDGNFLGTDISAPYSNTWDTTIYPHNSVHSIIANALDTAGNQASSSAAVSVTVLDITSPSVVITTPHDGAIVKKGSTVTISADVSDVSAIQKVEFRVNGSLKCTDITSPYSCSWKVPSRKNVTYTIEVKAYDIAGNTTTRTITVTAI